MAEKYKYTGYSTISLSDEELAALYENKSVIGLLPNEYGIILNKDGEVVDKYCGTIDGIRRVHYHTIGDNMTGVFKPRNLEQELAFDLMSSDVPVKLVTGTWGTGKTMCLCAAAIEQINKGKFDKIVWVRNNIEVKDTTPLGALPGSEWDKLAPFVGPLADHVGGDEGLRQMFERGTLDVVHLGYLRGRDLRNCIIMCSESENMTKEHLQLLLGRVGEGSALWLDADIKQRDKVVFEKSAGIETMIERLKGNPLFGYVHLVKSERSATSRLADLLD